MFEWGLGILLYFIIGFVISIIAGRYGGYTSWYDSPETMAVLWVILWPIFILALLIVAICFLPDLLGSIFGKYLVKISKKEKQSD